MKTMLCAIEQSIYRKENRFVCNAGNTDVTSAVMSSVSDVSCSSYECQSLIKMKEHVNVTVPLRECKSVYWLPHRNGKHEHIAPAGLQQRYLLFNNRFPPYAG